MNMLQEAKENQEVSMLEVVKDGNRFYADTLMLIGESNFRC